MQVVGEEDNQVPPPVTYKHDWIHLLSISISIAFFSIEVYQRISIDRFYAAQDNNTSIHVPSLNRYPTAFTPSPFSISLVWYLVFIWQTAWIIYTLTGIFRRTSSGTYFYQYPCAMDVWCFFHTAFSLALYLPQLIAAANNTYIPELSILHYVCTFGEVTITLALAHIMLRDNLRGYLRDKYFLDIWLTRLLYHNGLALWSSILFYESCLSIMIGLIYRDVTSATTACNVGCFLLFIGIIILSICEVKFCDTLAYTLTHWFTFLWLLGDVFIRSYEQFPSTCIQRYVPVLFYLTLGAICFRLRTFYLYYKDKNFPSFHPGKVYSLIDQPPTYF